MAKVETPGRIRGTQDIFGEEQRRFAQVIAPDQATANAIATKVRGGTSLAAHEAALRRIEQAGGRMISVPQLFCELQRDWNRKDTVPAFMELFIKTGGTAGLQFSYDRSE